MFYLSWQLSGSGKDVLIFDHYFPNLALLHNSIVVDKAVCHAEDGFHAPGGV